MSENTGYSQFNNWLMKTATSKEKAQILGVYSKKHLRSIANGESSIDGIPPGRRLKLYEMTSLDCFKVDVGVHPNELDPKKIIEGEQPRSALVLKLEYEGRTKTQTAQEFGVKETQFYRYLNGENVGEKDLRKIESGLIRIYGAGSQDTSEKPQQTGHLKAYENPIEQLNALLGGLSDSVYNIKVEIAKKLNSTEAARVLFQDSTPLEQRIRSVNLAINILADQVNYFRDASHEERVKLAKNIDADVWGYVAGILPKIDQPKSYQTVLRLMNRPKSKKESER